MECVRRSLRFLDRREVVHGLRHGLRYGILRPGAFVSGGDRIVLPVAGLEARFASGCSCLRCGKPYGGDTLRGCGCCSRKLGRGGLGSEVAALTQIGQSAAQLSL